MKYLIAGFGSIGRRHFRNLYKLGVRDFVFLRSGRSTLPDSEIADYPYETDLDSALSHHPDVVIVSNPTSLHLDVAIPAAEMGCHLFIEKPLSHSMDRIDRLQSAVNEGGGQVLVGFQFRYHPQLLKISELLSTCVIGDPISVHAEWGEYLPGWHPWEDYRNGYSAREDLGGGVVLTLCHPFDYLSWFFGKVSDLWAFVSKVGSLDIEVDGLAEIGLRFQNGMTGIIHLDFIQQPATHTLTIIGTEGKIDWNYLTGRLLVYVQKDNKPDQFELPVGYERNDMFEDQMKHLIAVCQGVELPRCSLLDGITAQELVMAVYESSSEKKIISW
jgi:predicted dehydrogenase